ncbi:hypothetical protein ATKI12_8766 [Kitasatospora sp. Ki12]
MTAPYPPTGVAPWWQGGTGAGGIPHQHQPGRKTAIPGLAPWDTRAMATAIELGLAGGIMTAYTAILYIAKPAFAVLQVVGMLVGLDVRAAFTSAYWLLGAGFLTWQWAVRGRTGESIGQRLMGIVLVDEDTGAPVGPARSVIRSLCHVVDILPAFAGYARPVVHPRCQTFADSITHTVVVKRSLINSIAQ